MEGQLRQAIAEHTRSTATPCAATTSVRWAAGSTGRVAAWGTGRPSWRCWTNTPSFTHRRRGGGQINAGHYAQAERLIGSGTAFAQVSTEVATLLTRAKRGL
jgi:methyl-accepting chemotaxis protein